MLKIVMTGEDWHGSDCTGLARGFRELGHAVELVALDRFVPRSGGALTDRTLRRLLTPRYRRNYNAAFLSAVQTHQPDLCLVYKGAYLDPATVAAVRRAGPWLCNFYPDVSLTAHRDINPAIFPCFDHVFTTKSFGLRDLASQCGVHNASYLPHGFDPTVHRPVATASDGAGMVDVSFIGTWSAKKEHAIDTLLANAPDTGLAIWGAQWGSAVSARVRGACRGHAVIGDYYALAIGRSRINLGLLSEVRENASSGDQITSRTFHIPAAGGFLLHERTDEVLEFYREDIEIACFDGAEELADKVRYYLQHEDQRQRIARAGHERCLRDNRLSSRARVIVDTYLAARHTGGAMPQ